MSVGEVCNRETVIIQRGASILETAKLMRSHHVGSIVVVEDESAPARPLGIITDRDLVVEVMAGNVDLERLTVEDVMQSDLITAAEGDSIWDTIDRMRTKGVRRIPVVDAQGMLAGILSMDDLLDFLVEELSNLVGLVKRELTSEQATRTRP